jgi:hypothetical protein
MTPASITLSVEFPLNKKRNKKQTCKGGAVFPVALKIVDRVQ